MKLTKRLEAVASFIVSDRLTDIGTDHGYIPIYALKTGMISHAIACDISADCVEKCRQNAELYGVLDRLHARKADGLDGITSDEAQSRTLVIAGMGGQNICEILSKRPGLTKCFKQLILQPQSFVSDVRRMVHHLGFVIDDERMVQEGHFYMILSCININELCTSYMSVDEPYTDIEYLWGRVLLKRRCPVLKEYLEQRLEVYNGILHEDITQKRQEVTEGLSLWDTIRTSGPIN